MSATKAKKLVIVESPTKAKTIGKFLGKEYIVTSSYGHLRDLPKSKMGIDIENNFEPSYIIPMKSRKRASELKKEAKKVDEIILATDEDREGEAIAWHITYLLGEKIYKRIVFHEITKKAIEEAMANPRELNLNLVDAQQARRVLDRLVGYELSPFLWEKIFRGLSAGRVQSVAVRLIVKREQEIEKFNPEEFWDVEANLTQGPTFAKVGPWEITCQLFKKEGELLDKFAIKNEDEAKKITSELEGANYKVTKVTKKESRRQPSPPFTTSTLQQTSANKLGYSAKQTMMFAQQLYEQGFITYMRTDSVSLSNDSLVSAKNVIESFAGKEFSLDTPRRFKTKSKSAQEAHEAIRPADPTKTPDSLKEKLDSKQFKTYDLIWRRFIACQMKEAVFDSTNVEIKAIFNSQFSISKQTPNYTFKSNGQILKFEGWLKIYQSSFTENILPELKEGDELKLLKLSPNQHFTEPPPRYSEATLIKVLEEYGIGRPSTYAPTIATIQTRNYVVKNEQRKFAPTEVGVMVDDILVEHFPNIVDINFTAKMEESFDKIAQGKIEWQPVIKNFYEPFHKNVEKKYEEVEKKHTEEETDEVCDKCTKPMIIKHGRFGKFLACSGFPDCKNAKPIKADEPKSTGVKCPQCPPEKGEPGNILERVTRKRKIFFSCSKYPECTYALWNKPTGEKCQKCDSLIVEVGKGDKTKCSNKLCK